MQHCQKSRLDLSPHFSPHLLELIILFDFYIWQGPIMQFPMFFIFEYSKILHEQLQILKQRSPAGRPRVVDGVIFLPIKINFLLRIDFLLSDRLFLNEKGRI